MDGVCHGSTGQDFHAVTCQHLEIVPLEKSLLSPAPKSTATPFGTTRQGRRRGGPSSALRALIAGSLSVTAAQQCISLAGSAACASFNASSISTDSAVAGLFPFLSSVTDTATFDSGLEAYIGAGFTQQRYQQLIGCSNVNLDNTTAFYARYTTSVLCNAIVQNSIQTCALTGNAARPLCADSCAAYAQSEEEITASNVCGVSNAGALTQIRADFTNCALPADSLTGTCIAAEANEPNNCGYASNTGGLCSYCAASSPNATDSCCVFSDVTSRCVGVTLPVIASSALAAVTITALTTPSSAATDAAGTSAVTAASTRHGLTGGQIAGVVVGSVLGALLLLALLIVGCLMFRRRRDQSPHTSVFNQPATSRQIPPMAFNDGAPEVYARHQPENTGLAAIRGGRVTRMSALEGSSSGDDRGFGKSVSDDDNAHDLGYNFGLAPPPNQRSGSLSSGSQLGVLGHDQLDASPSTQNDYTSPESHGQSEQLQFFKDYYSQDEITTGDAVATLWAYEPRAGDEFHLERGDIIKVIGIWDDGWATGVRLRQRAEDWRPQNRSQRDSGLSNGSSSKPPDTSDGEGEVKAFPLVCVCLPQHWRKTIEGESTQGSGPPDFP
nr:hypothetical protein CFP56_12057 [Quercus suber]